MRALALLLALLFAPQAALANVAAFSKPASGVQHEISPLGVRDFAGQPAEARPENAHFYGESTSGIVDDPINHRDPTGEQVPPSGARPPRVPSMQLNLLNSRLTLNVRLQRALREVPPEVREQLTPPRIGRSGSSTPIEELESLVRRAEFEAAMARMSSTEQGAFDAIARTIRGDIQLQLPAPLTATQWRNRPGVASGSGTEVVGPRQWLVQGRVAMVPAEVAARLRGRSFGSFEEFQTAFWRAVAQEPQLLGQFSSSNQTHIRNGNAPFAPPGQQTGRGPAQTRYNLHHKQPISEGGGVYDVDNILVVSPWQHYIGIHGQGGD